VGIVVFLLVLASATLHVLWNTLVKTCRDKVSFAWLTTVVGTLLLLPVFVGLRVFSPGMLDGRVLGLAALSGLVETAYILALFAAYAHTDLSVAYPLSRGFAPVVTLVPGILLLGDHLNVLQGWGLAVIVVGVCAVSGSALAHSPSRAASWRGVVLALLSAALIGGYHLVDRYALKLEPAPPAILEYYFLMHTAMVLALTVALLAWPGYRHRLFREWPGNRTGVLAVGVLSVISYLLILMALRLGNVTLVSATRNCGIAISTAVGALVLRERVSPLRAIGALVIVAGVLILLLGRG